MTDLLKFKMGFLTTEKTEPSGQKTLHDRVKRLLVSYEWSDCSFSVSGKLLRAHKLILGISSPVFEAMFFGPLSADNNIVVTDIKPEIFQLLLNYLYTDTAEIASIDQAFALLYASRKYLLEHLTDTCIEYIKCNITVDNVMDILNYPDYMVDEKITKHAINLFCAHASYFFQELVNLITPFCLKIVLESNEINVSEKELIKYVFNWAAYCCHHRNLPLTIENKHNILMEYDILKLLRFATLSDEELKGLYTDANNTLMQLEYEAIKKSVNKTIETAGEIPLATDNGLIPRKPLKLKWFTCFRSPLRSMAPIKVDPLNHIIYCRIRANKSVFIKSVCVPTRMENSVYIPTHKAKVYSEQLLVSVIRELTSSIIQQTNFMNIVDYDSLVNIELNEPCLLKKDEWYRFSFAWQHNISPTYYYIVEFRDKLLPFNGHNVTFEFEDLPRTTRNGSFLTGLKFCL